MPLGSRDLGYNPFFTKFHILTVQMLSFDLSATGGPVHGCCRVPRQGIRFYDSMYNSLYMY
jgi:hypothetical protein